MHTLDQESEQEDMGGGGAGHRRIHSTRWEDIVATIIPWVRILMLS